ncbi:unnamed protein product, partial [Polarella glacialis]
SSLLEPLEKIFDAAPKPQKGSTFPLTSVVESDIILWQDYDHDDQTVKFTDLLALFVGESVGIRRPGQNNIKVRNVAPCFYSGRAMIRSQLRDSVARDSYNSMMDERFTIFEFFHPLPMTMRQADWPQCAKCCADLILSGSEPAEVGAALGSTVANTSPSSVSLQTPDLVAQLSQLANLFSTGLLTVDEFAAAKRRLFGQQ